MMRQSRRRRNSLRYTGYDYAQPGAVFVTVCTAGRQRLFGSVMDGRMVHSPAGALVVERIRSIPARFPGVAVDAFVVMPDHLHGIVVCGAGTDEGGLRATVGDVVRWLKTSVSRLYGAGVNEAGWPPYDRQLWQRDYYDRIIRTEAELAAIRAYIDGNPGRWWERHGHLSDDAQPSGRTRANEPSGRIHDNHRRGEP